MARVARKKAEFLHVILRGVGKQIIFENDADRYAFLSLLKKYRDEEEITIGAYCLMDNHVHLLIHDSFGNVSDFMQKLGLCYAMYFNRKYERVGHLFQNRFKSEIINDEAHYFTVYRYIINNPVKAGLGTAAEYPWSSYKEFGKKGVTDSTIISGKISDRHQLNLFLSIEDDTEVMESDNYSHNDEWVIMILKTQLNIENISLIKAMPKKERDKVLYDLKRRGASIRQIERITGVNRGVINLAGR